MIPAAALACTCVSPADLSREELAAVFEQYPTVVRARIVSTEQPLRCRLAPVRWLYAAVGESGHVRHILSVRSVIRGRSPASVAVIQKQSVDVDGCHTSGSAACEPAFSKAEDVWVLRPLSSGNLERAPMCTERLVRSVLAV